MGLTSVVDSMIFFRPSINLSGVTYSEVARRVNLPIYVQRRGIYAKRFGLYHSGGYRILRGEDQGEDWAPFLPIPSLSFHSLCPPNLFQIRQWVVKAYQL